MTIRQKRTLIWLLLILGLAILLIWAGRKAWRITQATQSLLGRQTEVELLLADGLMNTDPDDAETLIYGVRRDVVTLRDETAFLMPFMPFLGWLPQVGPLTAVAPQLMEMADSGTEAAAYGFRGLKPALVILQDDSGAGMDMLPDLVDIIEAGQPDIYQASQAVDRLVIARSELGDLDQLPWRLSTILTQVDPYLPIGQDSLKLALVLPELMGQEGTRRYLIMAQNQDELRPTGGFLSGAGLLEMRKGHIVDINFQDGSLVDAWDTETGTWTLTKPYGDPPQPLTDLMLLDLFLFRDANFWPDFPTSAQQAMDLYSYGQDIPPLDGAIAIDQRFLQLLIETLGSVPLKDSEEIISSGNVIPSLQAAWTLDGHVTERKSFLASFADAIREQIESNLDSIDPLFLARNMYKAIESGHLQIYMANPKAAQVLEEIAWDGRLPTTNLHDYLLVVDTNVGYNKANLFIEREMAYDVALHNDGSAQAMLTISHIHTGEANGEPCTQGTLDEYEAGSDYLALADECYWNYLRIYVPNGSNLQQGPGHIVPAETWYGSYDWDQSTGVSQEVPSLTTFNDFMLVPLAEKVDSLYKYSLPDSVTQQDGNLKEYTLSIDKQAGIAPYLLTFTITLPDGAELINVQPEPEQIQGNQIRFLQEINQDEKFTLTFR